MSAFRLVRTVPEEIFDRSLPRGEFSVLGSYVAALRGAKKLIYLENQFLWSPEIGRVLVDKLENPPADDFRLVVLLPARANDGADVSRGQVASLIHADDGNGRFLGTTIFARSATMRDTIYVHSKIGIVDDAWFTIGSANLNEHSLFNDSEMNVVSLDESLARETRLRLWAEHLERPDRGDRRGLDDDRRRALEPDRRRATRAPARRRADHAPAREAAGRLEAAWPRHRLGERTVPGRLELVRERVSGRSQTLVFSGVWLQSDTCSFAGTQIVIAAGSISILSFSTSSRSPPSSS